MKRRTFIRGFFASACFFVLKPASALANVPSVRLEAKKAESPGDYVITVHVTHRGNSALHHINRVVLFRDGTETQRWEYSFSSRPPSENFSVTHTVKVQKETIFSAAANCNLHGENQDKGEIKVAAAS